MKLAYSILLLVVIVGCRTPTLIQPTVLTETRGAEKLTMQEPTPTGDKKDVPAGVSLSDVVSTETFSHASGAVGKIVTTQESKGWFKKPKKSVYMNCTNCHGVTAPVLPVQSTTPKRSWWEHVELVYGGLLVVIVGALYALKRVTGLGWVLTALKKLLK